MSAFTASSRIASMRMGMSTEVVERLLADHGDAAEEIIRQADMVNIQFSFGKITWPGVDAEIEAYIELHNRYPEVMVFDNLMDIEDASSDYTEQMEVMNNLTDLARATGATVIVLHHASDKSWEAKSDPWSPPSRDQVKGGLSEKPELSLSVALNPQSHEYRVACIKQRMGPCDPTAQSFARIRAIPDKTQFAVWGEALGTI